MTCEFSKALLDSHSPHDSQGYVYLLFLDMLQMPQFIAASTFMNVTSITELTSSSIFLTYNHDPDNPSEQVHHQLPASISQLLCSRRIACFLYGERFHTCLVPKTIWTWLHCFYCFGIYEYSFISF